MKERPILFSYELTRALDSGTKTQMRRIVKPDDSGRVSLHGRSWHLDDPDAVLACPNCGQSANLLFSRKSSIRTQHKRTSSAAARISGMPCQPVGARGRPRNRCRGSPQYAPQHAPQHCAHDTLAD